MPPKRKRGTTKDSSTAAKKAKSSEEPIDLKENYPVIYIEACRSCSVFKRRAEQLYCETLELLQTFKPDFEIQMALNADGPPRRGSFEIAIAAAPSIDAKERNLIWTGLKNTPRATKFPQAEKIADNIKAFLNLDKVDSSKVEESVKIEKSEISTASEEVIEEDTSKAPTTKNAKRGRSKK